MINKPHKSQNETCKKCDDGRPCNRCIKLGLTATCRDSDRKERKKGVKRGPYKKRQAPVRKTSSMSSADEQQLDDAHTTQAQAVNVCPLTYQYTTTDISDSHAHFHNTSSVSKNHNQMANEALTIDLRDSICYPQGNSSIPTASASSSSLSLSTASSLLPSPIISNISLDLSESDETLHYAYGYTAPTTAATSSNNQHRCNLSSTTASTTSKMLEHQTISGNVTPSINANYQQFYSQESDFHYLQQGSIYDIQQPYQCLNMTDNFAVFINNENNGNPFQIEKCVRQQFLPDAQNVDGNFTTNMMLLDSNTYTIEQQQATKNEFTAIYYNSNTKIPTATTTLLLQQQYDNTI
ncbi:hypothetical protein BDF20DRAFT_273512 [Mycotypha africana]|uniref:uncharacterized protein n=1 Tax=Mycotypha africana TaxID=64632 RepID=UPI0022FFD8F6|nr:uncharacterized protein BDF20DRAFT_273512 [Mycotypha africana]KAI8987554.1 hypothetical protein BDF20DRAFT_273512 [Mycotypha africana]